MRGKTIPKRHVLAALLAALSFSILFLAYLYLTYPITTETFTLAPAEKTIRELNLHSGQQAFIWLSAMPPGISGRYAMDWVIVFYVNDTDGNEILYDPGIAATGWFYPRSFVAQKDGKYEMHFENTVGGAFDKTVTLSFKISPTFLGISIEQSFIIVTIILGASTLALGVWMLIEKITRRTSRRV